ncbi:MAG: aminoglycoside phosphotransferase family protein [Planctomycetota bacterium]
MTASRTLPLEAPAAAAAAFAIPGELTDVVPYGSGHINDTYAVTFTHRGANRRYLLQRINHRVFRDVPALMSNISRVCAHARARLEAEGAADLDRRVLTLVPTRDGQVYHLDEAGLYWRVYLFIEGATGHDVVQSPEQAYAAASAFGRFQRLLTDLPGERLHETIPDFHHTPKRLAAFDAALSEDRHNRAADAAAEIAWLEAHRGLAGALVSLRERGLVPERVTHNDTKLNNVLLDDRTQEAVCVIDLDTLMPGLALYDFGDLVRTSTSPVAEDEPDPSRVTMRLPMFEALARGYLDATHDFLTPAEVESLPLAGQVITLTIGIRFLTDYLQGDRYFKTKHPGHNLQRCRTQFALVDSMIAQHERMLACVHTAAG